MYVKPKDGRQVPDPDRGDVLPVEGREVNDQQYWQRRIEDGDVEVAEPPKDSASVVKDITK